jgi:hypothetical protein
MSIAEVKETKSNLIAWISQLSDSKMLVFLDGLRNAKPDHDWWDDLSDTQKQEINEGIADAEAGRVITSEEFWSRLKKA